MPTLITHAMVGAGLGTGLGGPRRSRWFWLAAAAVAVAPDLDAVGYLAGVEYGHPWGHRGISHSPFMAVLLATAAWGMLRRWDRVRPGLTAWALLVLAAGSHGLMDAMTDGGLGVAFLAPFSPERFFLPFRPIRVAPIGLIPFFSRWGLRSLASEVVWIWVPLGALIGAVRFASSRVQT